MCWFHGCYHGRYTLYNHIVFEWGTLMCWFHGCYHGRYTLYNLYNILCLNGTLPCVDFMGVIMGGIPYITMLCLNGTLSGVDFMDVIMGDILLIARAPEGIPHDNTHEINTWKCPIQTRCGTGAQSRGGRCGSLAVTGAWLNLSPAHANKTLMWNSDHLRTIGVVIPRLSEQPGAHWNVFGLLKHADHWLILNRKWKKRLLGSVFGFRHTDY